MVGGHQGLEKEKPQGGTCPLPEPAPCCPPPGLFTGEKREGRLGTPCAGLWAVIGMCLPEGIMLHCLGQGFEESEDDADALMAQAEVQGTLPGAGVFSSDDEAESCPICLNAFRDQAVGTPESCAHYFCLDCIVEWAKVGRPPAQRATSEQWCVWSGAMSSHRRGASPA